MRDARTALKFGTGGLFARPSSSSGSLLARPRPIAVRVHFALDYRFPIDIPFDSFHDTYFSSLLFSRWYCKDSRANRGSVSLLCSLLALLSSYSRDRDLEKLLFQGLVIGDLYPGVG